MKTSGIFKYISLTGDNSQIAFVTRSALSTWSVSYKNQLYSSTRNRHISSYEQLSNEDIETIRKLNIEVFDFETVPDADWGKLSKAHSYAHEIYCY